MILNLHIESKLRKYGRVLNARILSNFAATCCQIRLSSENGKKGMVWAVSGIEFTPGLFGDYPGESGEIPG